MPLGKKTNSDCSLENLIEFENESVDFTENYISRIFLNPTYFSNLNYIFLFWKCEKPLGKSLKKAFCSKNCIDILA